MRFWVLAFAVVLAKPLLAEASTCSKALGSQQSSTPKKILFMCVANSARSQLAESVAQEVLGDKAIVQSAGSQPKTVNPFAIQALNEVNISTEGKYSKSIDQLDSKFIEGLDYIITLCADEVCPFLPSKTAKKLHWPLPDPAAVNGTDAEKLESFRNTREELRRRIIQFGQNSGLLEPGD